MCLGSRLEERCITLKVQSCPAEGPGVGGRAATVVGIPKISRYTDFFQNSVFLEAKGGALLYVQKSVKLGIFATFFLKSL